MKNFRNDMSWLTRLLLVVILFVAFVMMASKAFAATERTVTPEQICNNLVSYWDSRTTTYSNGELESSVRKGDTYYCIARFDKDMVEYTMPENIKFVYNYKTDAYTAKRWGI